MSGPEETLRRGVEMLERRVACAIRVQLEHRPNRAAAYYSSAAVAKTVPRAAEEVARVLRGERPLNVVNPEVYASGRLRR